MHEDVDRLNAQIGAALRGLSADQTQARPTAHPDKWSIQQIVEHLYRTYGATVPALEARLEKGTPTRAAPSLRQYLGQCLLISLGRFPGGRRAPAAVSPSPSSAPMDGADLGELVHGKLEQLDRVMAEGERMFGKARAVSHMVLGPLSMQQWRRFHLVHGRHHVKQIWKIRREHGLLET